MPLSIASTHSAMLPPVIKEQSPIQSSMNSSTAADLRRAFSILCDERVISFLEQPGMYSSSVYSQSASNRLSDCLSYERTVLRPEEGGTDLKEELERSTLSLSRVVKNKLVTTGYGVECSSGEKPHKKPFRYFWDTDNTSFTMLFVDEHTISIEYIAQTSTSWRTRSIVQFERKAVVKILKDASKRRDSSALLPTVLYQCIIHECRRCKHCGYLPESFCGCPDGMMKRGNSLPGCAQMLDFLMGVYEGMAHYSAYVDGSCAIEARRITTTSIFALTPKGVDTIPSFCSHGDAIRPCDIQVHHQSKNACRAQSVVGRFSQFIDHATGKPHAEDSPTSSCNQGRVLVPNQAEESDESVIPIEGESFNLEGNWDDVFAMSTSSTSSFLVDEPTVFLPSQCSDQYPAKSTLAERCGMPEIDIIKNMFNPSRQNKAIPDDLHNPFANYTTFSRKRTRMYRTSTLGKIAGLNAEQIGKLRHQRKEAKKARDRASARRCNLRKKLQNERRRHELISLRDREAKLRRREKILRNENGQLRVLSKYTATQIRQDKISNITY